MKTERILVIGANGQIGSVLVEYLRGIYGESKVLASDVKDPLLPDSYFAKLDATDAAALSEVVRKNRITQIYHLAAILSAKGEHDPLKTWHINMQTYFNVLEAARENGVKKIFYPSSIAVFGDHTDGIAEQFSFLDPATVRPPEKTGQTITLKDTGWISVLYDIRGSSATSRCLAAVQRITRWIFFTKPLRESILNAF
jgi:threonine 3-dehydrogenase